MKVTRKEACYENAHHILWWCKQQLAKTIIGMIPPHRVYCEPYFGGGAVFFSKGKSFCEVINDIDDRIITFYKVCQDPVLFWQLQEKIQHTLDSEREFKRADKIWHNPSSAKSSVDIAWSVWLLCNMGYGGSPEGGWKWDNATSGSHSAVVMDNYRNSFTAAIHERLRFVQISCRDALTVIRQRDTPDTFFFLDPPYPGCQQKHYSGFSFDDLHNLLDLLAMVKGSFLLCNYKSSILTEYIREYGWNTKVKDLPLRVANRTSHGQKRKQELFVFNYTLQPSLF